MPNSFDLAVFRRERDSRVGPEFTNFAPGSSLECGARRDAGIDLHRRAASYVGRILKGEKPGIPNARLHTRVGADLAVLLFIAGYGTWRGSLTSVGALNISCFTGPRSGAFPNGQSQQHACQLERA